MTSQREKERFGQMLRSEREKKNITLTKLAAHLKFSVPYLSDIERGNRAPPDNERILLAAELLGIPPKTLLREAAISRGVIELSADVPPRHQEMGAMLMRGWNKLTEDQVKQIEAVLRRGEDDDAD